MSAETGNDCPENQLPCFAAWRFTDGPRYHAAMINALFIGPGAIGSLLCWQWQQRLTPWVYPHRPALTLPRAIIDGADAHPLRWQLWPDDSHDKRIDLVLVCCKANQVSDAVTPLLGRFAHATWLLTCNGLGAQQWLANQLPGQVLWGSTTEGARPLGDGRVQRSGSGQTLIGPAAARSLSDRSFSIGQSLITPAGPMPISWHDDLLPTLWMKLAINAVINPITAWHGLTNGELLAPTWRAEIEALCAEISAVAMAGQQQLPDDLVERVLSVARQTSANHSSMRVDVDAGRATEIDFINGYLVRQGYEAGLKTPRLNDWYQRLLSLQPAQT
ncbi:2-dehydropantoate 2-reductase [Saccharospirillum sp. HFRX-1]|uniref:ketopantoate reductase family protein n=1 Tax=unclassified Saccharospirillum TaxID=2633430 RepID=UPI003716E1CA